MKRTMGIFLALVLVSGIWMNAFAAPAVSGAPEFVVATSLTASSLNVSVGETVNLTAVTTYTSQKVNQLLYLSSEYWLGVSSSTASAQPFEAKSQFVSTATFSSDVPGEYTITYGITLKHDESGKRTYSKVASITINVVEQAREPLSNGEIESTFSSWKKGKTFANSNDMYSMKWYNEQLDTQVFYAVSEVIAFLDSIYVAQ